MEDGSFEKIPFPETLKRLLKIHGMTLENLGSRLGITKQSVSQYVTGKAFPHALLLIQIAEIFDVSVDYLLTGKSISNENKLSGYIDQLIADEEFQKIYHSACVELTKEAALYPYVKRAYEADGHVVSLEDYMKLIETRATNSMNEFFQRYFKRVNIARSAYGDTPNEHFSDTKSGWSGTNERNFASVEL